MEDQTVQTLEDKVNPLEALAPNKPSEEVTEPPGKNDDNSVDSGNGHDKAPEGEEYGKRVKKRIDKLTWEVNEKQRKYDEYVNEMDNKYNTVLEINTGMRDEIDALQDKIEVRPDPMEDPDGYEKYLTKKTTRQLEREKRKIEKPVSKTSAQDKQAKAVETFNIQRDTLMGIYDDYDDVMAVVTEEINGNQPLLDKLSANKNVPLAAYNYGKQVIRQRETQRNKNINQGYAEGGTAPPTSNSKDFTDTDAKVCRDLGISKDVFIKYKGSKRR